MGRGVHARLGVRVIDDLKHFDDIGVVQALQDLHLNAERTNGLGQLPLVSRLQGVDLAGDRRCQADEVGRGPARGGGCNPWRCQVAG